MNKRKPKPETLTYRVRLRGVASFRRGGVEFTTENTPYDLSAAGLSEEQRVELLNTRTLDVEELGSSPARGRDTGETHAAPLPTPPAGPPAKGIGK